MFVEINRKLKSYKNDLYEALELHIKNIIKKYHVEIQYHDNAGIFLNDHRIGALLLNYYSHNNAFCTCVKKHCSRCCLLKDKISMKAQKVKRAFYGTCYMGVEEFVFPVLAGEHVIGYFTVGEFCSDLNRSEKFIKNRASDIKADGNDLYDAFLQTVREINFNIDELISDMNMLINCISLYVQNNIKCDVLPAQNNSGNYLVDMAKEYIFSHYDDDVTLGTVAKICHCNGSYLSHLFKRKTGMTISDYITSFRITRAKYYLSITDYSVTRISEMVGYNDSGYFARVFKKHTGVSPYLFRKQEIPK